MQLAETVKLELNISQTNCLRRTMNAYIEAVNNMVALAVEGIDISRYTSKDVNAEIPSACRNQAVRDAKSVIKRYKRDLILNQRKQAGLKTKRKKETITTIPTLRKLVCFWNNQNFKIVDKGIQLPVIINGKSKRILVKTYMTNKQQALLSSAPLGTLRLSEKNSIIVANIAYSITEPGQRTAGGIMGIDLGIKCPAVCYTNNGKAAFYGNGRKNKAMRRHYSVLRNSMQRAKHPEAVEHINNKEQRIMRDTDHKISRAIVNKAVRWNVGIIKMERLKNIRATTRKSRKNNHSLHNWSFYRLSKYIEYKAKLAGIDVVYVNPAFTSQKCPVCGKRHHAQDRLYKCKCGYRQHRDLVGAINICNSTEIVGKRLSA